MGRSPTLPYSDEQGPVGEGETALDTFLERERYKSEFTACKSPVPTVSPKYVNKDFVESLRPGSGPLPGPPFV